MDNELNDNIIKLSDNNLYAEIYSKSFHNCKYLVRIFCNNSIEIFDIEKNIPIHFFNYKNCSNGHIEECTSICINKKGTLILTGSSDKSTKLWNPDTGECISTFMGHEKEITDVKFISNDEQILTVSDDSTFKIWDIKSCTCVYSFEDELFKNDFKVTLSNSENLILVYNYQQACILDLLSKKKLFFVKNEIREITFGAFSNDESKILLGSKGSYSKLFDIANGTCIKTLVGKYYNVEYKSFGVGYIIEKYSDFSSGNFLCDNKFISCSDKGSLSIWNIDNSQLEKKINLSNESIYLLDYCPKKNIIILRKNNNNISIFNLSNETELNVIQPTSYSISLSNISSNGSNLITYDELNRGKIWNNNLSNFEKIDFPNNYTSSIAISNNKKFIITGSYDSSVKIWNTNTRKCDTIINELETAILSIDISNDDNSFVSSSSDKTIMLWDLEDMDLIDTIYSVRSGLTGIKSVKITKDSKYIIFAEREVLKIYNLKTLELEKEFIGFNGDVESMSLSDDSSYVVIARNNNELKLWNFNSGKLLKTLVGHSGKVNSVKISSDNKFIVSGSDDYTIKIWDLNSGKLLSTLINHHGEVKKVSINNQLNQIVSVSLDGSIKVWDISSDKNLLTIYNLHEGFLYTTSNEYNELEYFWTDKPDLLNIYEFDKIKNSKILLDKKDPKRIKFINNFNSKDIILSKINL